MRDFIEEEEEEEVDEGRILSISKIQTAANYHNDNNPVRISRQFGSRGALEEREETRKKVSLGDDF